MAISALSQLDAEASAEPELGSDEQRMHVLADTLAMKLRLGYEIESETEFGAVIFSPSPRRWLGIRKGQDNQRFAIQIHRDRATNIERNKPKPHEHADPRARSDPAELLRLAFARRAEPLLIARKWPVAELARPWAV